MVGTDSSETILLAIDREKWLEIRVNLNTDKILDSFLFCAGPVRGSTPLHHFASFPWRRKTVNLPPQRCISCAGLRRRAAELRRRGMQPHPPTRFAPARRQAFASALDNPRLAGRREGGRGLPCARASSRPFRAPFLRGKLVGSSSGRSRVGPGTLSRLDRLSRVMGDSGFDSTPRRAGRRFP